MKKVPFNDLALHHRLLQPQLREAMEQIIEESAFIRGREVDLFEESFARLMGSKHCISCANGTDAIYIAMRGLGIKNGDEVITTAHTWISSAETITQAGGRVVFCDTRDDNFTIDARRIEDLITPRTVGIIPVHLYGQPADMDSIMAVARKHNLWVIEDCAQAHLAKYRGQTVGTFGQAATFSFYPGKNLGAMGDAGCLVTNDDALARWCALYARHGGKGDHLMEGVNSRLDGIQAAVLNVKLPHLPQWTNLRRKHAATYGKLLSGCPDVMCPRDSEGTEHVYHLYVVRSSRRDALRAHLGRNGVETVINYSKALPFYPAYAYLGHREEDFPNAFSHQHEILSLPIYPEMTEEQIVYVCEIIRQFAPAE